MTSADVVVPDGSVFGAMAPAAFSRALLDHFDHFDIRDHLPTWRTALNYFDETDWSPVYFEGRLAQRAGKGSEWDAGSVVARRLLDRWRHRATWPAYQERALAAPRRMLGPDATFRAGQWEAIDALVGTRSRVLIVENVRAVEKLGQMSR